MLSSRFIRAVLTVTMVVSPGIVSGGDHSKVPDSRAFDEQEDRNLLDICRTYQRESARVTEGEKQSFLTSAESKLKKALASRKGSSAVRLQVMDALGSTQIAMGKEDDAVKTYEKMEEYATKVDIVESQVAAGTKQLDLLASKPDEIFIPAIAKLEGSIEQLAKQRKDAAAREMYSGLLYHMGVVLTTRAMARDYAGNPATLLDMAINSLEKSAALVENDTASYAGKMLWLARAQCQMGFQAEAAASYEKAAQVSGGGFSRLWLEYLRMCEITTKDSKEYQAALERALADSHDRDSTDDYEPVLRHILGLSYRNVKQYAKSSDILAANLEKRGDLLAHDMLLIAWNARDTKDVVGARKILEEIVAKYPETGGGQTARGELNNLIYQPLPPEAIAGTQRPKRGILIGANLAAITILVAIFVRRQVRKKPLNSGSV